jgi:HPt (histidine-containing phosphotransfer) domain-containing protein
MTAPIDLEHLNRYVFGDKALLLEILGIFKEQSATLCDRLQASVDDEAWRLSAHTLKGAARGIGAFELGDALERAEGLFGSLGVEERSNVLNAIVDLAKSAADYADRLIIEAA